MPVLGSFWWALGIGWVALGIAGWQYAGVKHIPAWVAVPVAAAFLIEYAFYLAAGMPAMRQRLSRWSRPRLATALTASGLAPYLLYSTLTGEFRLAACGAVLAIAAGVSFWYIRLRPVWWTDLTFLVLLAAAVLSGVLRALYTSPVPRLPLEILGHLMLIHVAVLAVLLLRGMEDAGLGFIPSAREVWTGLRYSALFCVVGLPLAFALQVVHLPAHPPPAWRVAALLLGVFWVVAYSEEFFFRGLLQTWLSQWCHSGTAGLLLASLCFGLVHLNYGRQFPNWRVALCAAIAGLFYGRALQSSRSVRASIVAHAIVVTVWKSLAA